ncbi:MAG: DUF4166 domain-containing protein [Chloroflexi bacterium]|nr:MAG: DUF4166 domain-containing protein [Chloroflexota bacterium]MBL1195601.1 DUF4166 domain-containing protein [Chloroflexota bacterium]NOH12888.1 DUF4166 domain-containing protein [Chloroflexota bacterium]
MKFSSPFDPLFQDIVEDLPTAFKHQFLHAVDDQTDVVFEGQMDEVWHRPKWLWPFFWLSAQFDILFPETGSNVPATMKLVSSRDKNQQALQRWERTFHFKKLRYFNATMAYDNAQKSVVEWMGPGNSTEIVWDIEFHPTEKIEIITKGCNLKIGKLRAPLLKWFYPQVKATETAIGEDMIHIDLEVSHPLLGNIFGYHGNFKLQIIPKG